MLAGDLELLMKETPVTTDIHHWSLSLPPTCSTDSPTMCLFLTLQLPPICGSQLWSKQVLSLIPKDLDLHVHIRSHCRVSMFSLKRPSCQILIKMRLINSISELKNPVKMRKVHLCCVWPYIARLWKWLPSHLFVQLPVSLPPCQRTSFFPFITSSSFVSQAISQPYFWQGNRHSKKELSLISGHHKNLDEKNRHTGLYLPLSFCNCLFVPFALSPEMENVVLKRSKTQPLYAAVYFDVLIVTIPSLPSAWMPTLLRICTVYSL